jgi:hypothetical protein
VRIGSKTDDEFFNTLARKSDKICKIFQKNIEELTKPVSVKVMLGDTTIVEQTTFEPSRIITFYESIRNKMVDWETSGVSSTTDEDLRRIFLKLEKKIGNYILLWHISLQYHALLYYKPDSKVPKIQKELADLLDDTKNKEQELADLTDSIIKEKLEAMGYNSIDEQTLFEVLFNKDGFREQLSREINEKTDYDFKAKEQRKKELFNELDNLLMETYQTTSVLIDENRLVTGEEGCLCVFDLDFLKKTTKEAIFDPRRMSTQTKQEIENTFDYIITSLSN